MSDLYFRNNYNLPNFSTINFTRSPYSYLKGPKVCICYLMSQKNAVHDYYGRFDPVDRFGTKMQFMIRHGGREGPVWGRSSTQTKMKKKVLRKQVKQRNFEFFRKCAYHHCSRPNLKIKLLKIFNFKGKMKNYYLNRAVYLHQG